MAWATSNIPVSSMLAMLNGNASSVGTVEVPFYTASGTTSFHGDTVNVALYGNSVVTATAQTDTQAHNAYNASGGQWLQANELATAGGYTQTGIAVTPKTETITNSPNVATFTSSGTPNWTSASFTAYGALVYDNTIASKWVYCWNFFGGAQTVTSGTFTINWNASGIFAVTCS